MIAVAAKLIEKATNPLVGSWKLTHMDQWDEGFIDLDGPGFIRFDGTTGAFAFGAVHGEMHCKYGVRDGAGIVEWSWAGGDDSGPASGRGWARLDGNNKLVGHLFFHLGDDSAFEAARSRARLGREPRRPATR